MDKRMIQIKRLALVEELQVRKLRLGFWYKNQCQIVVVEAEVE